MADNGVEQHVSQEGERIVASSSSSSMAPSISVSLASPSPPPSSTSIALGQYGSIPRIFGSLQFLHFPSPVLILNFTNRERFNALTLKQFGLVVGKGLLGNVLSDYLWAKAVLLTTTIVVTAGLTIQVPLAAIVDSISGNKPSFTDYIGAAAVMASFAGINIPSEVFCRSKDAAINFGKV